MRASGVALIFFALGAMTSPSSAEVTWNYSYSVAESADEITSCQAGIDYTDGSFLVRVYGDTVDIFFFNQDLAVPVKQVLGNVAISIKEQTYVMSASSGSETQAGSSSVLFLSPEKSDIEGLFNGMRYGSVLNITFPDGTAYVVDLNGSEQAILSALQCWKDNPTGAGGKNPFTNGGDAAPATNNPFN